MKNKNVIIPVIIFFVVLVVFIIGYVVYDNFIKEKYSCIDYETGTIYKFRTEKEMHNTCDQFNGVEDDKILEESEIYNDLIKNNDSSYQFYPYVNEDKKVAIIITILDCDNPESAKEKAKKWFSTHSYNMSDYDIDYEYPCIS